MVRALPYAAARSVMKGASMRPSSSLICASLLTLAQLRADMVFSTIGPGADYAFSASVGLKDDVNIQLAVPFNPSVTSTLTAVALPLSVAAPRGALTLALVADANGAPGRLIEVFAVSDIGSTTPKIYTIPSAHHPRLDAKAQYWIVASAPSPAQFRWSNTANSPSGGRNSSSITRLEAIREDGGEWRTVWNPYIPGVTIYGETAKSRSKAMLSGNSPGARVSNWATYIR